MRWTLEDLERLKARSTVRTHIIRDDSLGRSPRAVRLAAKPIKLKLQERQVLRACLNALSVHPKVAFAWRQNVGAMPARGERKVRFAFTGCSDILGCLKGGRWMAIECKATGGKATTDQEAFLKRVNDAGGLGICVDDPALLVAALEAA